MILETFAGPGGWDTAAARLGLRLIGIEYGRDVCATRAAAGHLTIRADVRTVATAPIGDLDGFIASPPCPTFSKAGKGHGTAAIDVVLDAIDARFDGNDDLEAHRAAIEARTLEALEGSTVKNPATKARATALEALLTTEPVRWVRDCRPRWVALEQVRAALPVWQSIARHLEALGYSTWAGILEAERYGVPQTRERAILMASLDRAVAPPAPTHQRFVSGQSAAEGRDLFTTVKPWVSVAEALGWSDDDPRLAARIGFPRRDDLGTSPDGYRERDTRGADEPALVLTEKARSWVIRTPLLSRQSRHGDGAHRPYERSVDSPAPSVIGGARSWVFDRPATLTGDRRMSRPGHKHAGAPQMADSIPLELHEAATLQTFPADYPFVGSRTSRFQQNGDAVPPLLAQAILSALTQ